MISCQRSLWLKISVLSIFILLSFFCVCCSSDPSDESSPTGLPNGQIEQPQVMYDGVLYKYYATGIYETLPAGYVLVGNIEVVDMEISPTENFHACGTDLEVGQEVYADSNNTKEIIIRYDQENGWSGFASFYTDAAEKISVEGFNIENGEEH